MSSTSIAMTTTLRQRAAKSSPEAIVTDEGRKTDQLLDSHTRYVTTYAFFVHSRSSGQLKLLNRWEFGGPWGVTAMMIGFPMLMYYLWICLWFIDGRLVVPTSVDRIRPFIQEMWAHIRDVSFSPLGPYVANTIVSPGFLRIGCQPEPLRVEGLFRSHFLRTLSCMGHARVYARRLARAIPWIQDSHVQL